MEVGTSSGRVISVDQFRGYTVAGMFVVNFLGHMALTHHVLKHNNTHFSYADSIMPSFLFICGLSYRMSFLRRLPELGWPRSAWRYARRSLALILLSFLVFGLFDVISSWNRLPAGSGRAIVAALLKAHLWNVLAIIGAVQLLLLPVIATGRGVRVFVLALLAVVHVLLSWWFNYDFVYGNPNWMDDVWGTAGQRAWDGGFFGLVSWAEIMLAGTLAYDFAADRPPIPAARRLIVSGAAFMLFGYALSCLATLYDERDAVPKMDRAASPVWPPFNSYAARPWKQWLAPPPFARPPLPEERPYSYWMMDKRVVTQSFVMFSTGFAFVAYGIFVLACDVGGWQLGVFRTFGTNPLAAYIIHFFVQLIVQTQVPRGSPLWRAGIGLIVFFGITYALVRLLEQRRLYLRL